MACVVCQHCQGQVRKEDGVAVREGYSYHKKCHKCYVCSETDLHNAEVFKGVIFCYSCSQRIFQGCSSARKSKNGNRSQSARIKTKAKRKERRHQERRPEHAKTRHTEGVLELTRLAASTESEGSKSDKNRSRLSNTLALSQELSLQFGKEKSYDNPSKDFKKQSTEMGMTTEVTLELLRQMNCPIPERKHWTKTASPISYSKDKGDTQYNETILCSDLRVAELGASTEIAHMALRKRSEVPVIIKSESDMKAMDSLSMESEGNQGSDASGEGNDEWMESSYAIEKRANTGLLNRTVESILKMPYKSFKKNILDRSSLITVLMNSDKESWFPRLLLKRLKMIFHEEITEHRRRGVKRLYSTINRRRTPYRLGWLNLMAKVSGVMRPELALNNKIQPSIRCKHFNRSHSYRCMRAQVMRLAGPTKSELKTLRKKLKDTIAPQFVKDIIGFKHKNDVAIMMPSAGGSDVHERSTQRLK